MPKQLVATAAAFVATMILPFVTNLGLDPDTAREISAFAASGVFALASILWFYVSKNPKLAGPAAIIVGVVEEQFSSRPGAEKRTLAIAKLVEYIDGLDIGKLQKWFLKRAAPEVVDLIVAEAKKLLYKKPPER